MIIENRIDIICFQEAEIESEFKKDLLNIPGYTLELECNTIKQKMDVWSHLILKCPTYQCSKLHKSHCILFYFYIF